MKKGKKIWITAVIIVTVLAVFVVWNLVLSNISRVDTYSEDIVMCEDELFFWNKEGESYILEYPIYGDVESSADNSLCAYILEEEGDNVLYYITDDLEPVRIGENVRQCKVCYSGDYIAYLKAYTLPDDELGWIGDLYLYCVKTGNSKKIDSDVDYDNFIMSPNGKNISYYKNVSFNIIDDYQENELYVAGINKKPKMVAEDCRVKAVLNKYGELYYVTRNEEFCFYDGKNSRCIDTNCYIGETVRFNKGMDEGFYSRSDGSASYFTRKGKTIITIDDFNVSEVILPEQIVSYVNNGSRIYGIDKLDKVLLRCGGLYWFDGNDVYNITSLYTKEYKLSEDGKSIIYLDGGDLYLKELGTSKEAELLFKEDCAHYIKSSDDFSKIYLCANLKFYYMENEKEPITVNLMDGKSGGGIAAYDEFTSQVYFIEEDTLYKADTSEDSKVKVLENINWIKEYPDDVIMVYFRDGLRTMNYYMIVEGEIKKLYERE